MYVLGSKENKYHVATYGPLTKFGYKDFIPMFKAEHYDPVVWARLFKRAGAKYVVPVFEHHDGFAMYDSGLSDWTAAKMGPHRDLAGELAKAVHAEGLYLGASSHRIEHDWFLYPGRTVESDVNDPKFAGFYGPAHVEFALDVEADNFLEDWTYVSPEFANDWLARDAEIVEKYHPELFYFDFWIGHPELRDYLARFAAFFYNESSSRGSVGVINYKLQAMHPHSAVLDVERVAQAIEKVRPKLQKQGGTVDLIAVADTVVQVNLESAGQGCGSSPEKLKQLIEQAIREAAPEVVEIQAEGLPSSTSGFVPLNMIQSAAKEENHYEESAA